MLYDVILVGFPAGPRVGSSPAQAIAHVFGIPEPQAAEMAESVPCIVRSGVPEAVARKYFNAFAYIGAMCEFRTARDTESLSAPGFGVPPAPAVIDRLAEDRANTAFGTGGGPGVTMEEETDTDLSVALSTADRVELPPGAGPLERSSEDTRPNFELHTIEDEATALDLDLGDLANEVASAPNLSEMDGSWVEGVQPQEFEPAPVASNRPQSETGVPLPMDASPRSGAGPSVAEIRAAWEAGRDITLTPDAEPSGFDLWEAWVDDDMAEADFPSGMPIDPDSVLNQREYGPGTQLEAPRNSELLRALDARRAQTGGIEFEQSQAVSVRAKPATESVSGAALFGAPIGSPISGDANSNIAGLPHASTPEPQPQETLDNEPTRIHPVDEVPKAALNFRRLKKRRSAHPNSD